MQITLQSSQFDGDRLEVFKFHGTSSISQLFSWVVEVLCLDRDQPVAASLLGQPVTIVLSPPAPYALQNIHGIIAEIDDHLWDGAGRRVLRLRVTPRAQRLALGFSQDVYLKQSVPDLIQAKLAAVGLATGGATADVQLNLTGTYAAREFVVQYRETDLAFLCRLAEHVGISFFFVHGADAGDVERIVFTDFADGFNVCSPPPELAFSGRGEERGIFRIAVEHRMVPVSYTTHDYNYRLPQIAPVGTFQLPADVGYAGDVIEEGSHARSPSEAQYLAQVRAEERQATQLVYVGRSTLPIIQAGLQFKLVGHPELDGVALTVIEATHEGTQGAGNGDGGGSYVNSFRAIPSDRTFRPPRITPRPRIYGLVSGLIDASQGGNSVYAPIDDQGRYHVRFFFDLATPAGQAPSHAIRMIQNHAGAGYGTHLPLKPGAEVLLAFIDGDPDRPLIVGAAPNPLTPSPVVAANSDLHIIRTQSGTRIECK